MPDWKSYSGTETVYPVMSDRKPEGKSDDLMEAAIRVVDAAREDLLLAKAAENKALLRQVAISVVHGALLAERQRDRWLTIDTAPRDGTKIDVCRPSHGTWGERITDVWWSAQKKAWVHWGDTGFGSMGEARIRNPSHWMATPPYPSTEENLQHD